jgi:eukaryotic translation initiation factor 2C
MKDKKFLTPKPLTHWACYTPSILNKKTMVVGIDVNHPSPGEQAPSIAAVVGSIDQDFSQYRTEIRVNSSRDEIVAVDQMIVPILKAFKAKPIHPPPCIVIAPRIGE